MICSDSIDQSHWALPRDPDLANIKALATFQRPTCVVVCVWVVGLMIRFFVLDQDQPHGSSTTIDVVGRTLEEVAEIFRSRGRTLPVNLIYWVTPMH